MPSRLSRAHLKFLVIEEVVGSSIVNFLLNGGIAWLLFRSTSSVPLWGATSIAMDTWVTAFVLPVLTSLIARVLVRAQVARGKLAAIPSSEVRESPWLRRSSLQRGALVGIAAMAVVATPVVGTFVLAGLTHLSTSGFIWFKASFAAGLGALVTPLLGWWELQNASRQRSSTT